MPLRAKINTLTIAIVRHRQLECLSNEVEISYNLFVKMHRIPERGPVFATQPNRTEDLYTISTRSIPYLSGSAIDRGSRNRIRTNTVAQMFAPRYHRVPASTTTATREFNANEHATKISQYATCWTSQPSLHLEPAAYHSDSRFFETIGNTR